jgi:uncharacterized protein (DUF1499 family)
MTANYPLARFSTARYTVKEAREATWARRLALFFVQLLILTALLHRFLGLGTPAAVNLIGVSMAGLFVALAIAMVSLVRIWFGGQVGAAQDLAAVFLAVCGLALPLFYLAHVAYLPWLTDIETTSPDDVLQFTALAEQRPADANPLTNPTAEDAAFQAKAYPDLQPMFLERAAPEVFSIVHEAVEHLGWKIVVNEAPGETGVGRIEATARTLIMGFTDDVIVRVKGDDAHTQIDIRSVSRYGKHDFGANAKRIRAFYAEVTAALEKGEKTVLEQAMPKKDQANDPQAAAKMRGKRGAGKRH